MTDEDNCVTMIFAKCIFHCVFKQFWHKTDIVSEWSTGQGKLISSDNIGCHSYALLLFAQQFSITTQYSTIHNLRTARQAYTAETFVMFHQIQNTDSF